MMGITHAGTGALAAVALGAYVHLDVPSVILLSTLLPGCALFSDIDHARSTVSNTYGPLTRTVSYMLHHRRETHSVPGILMAGFITYMSVLYTDHVLARVWLTLVLVLAWAAAIRLFKIKGWVDDFLPVPVAVAIVWFPDWLASLGLPTFPLSVLPAAVVIGMLVHLAGDVVTKQKCPIMWPLSSKGFSLKLFKAGGVIERLVIRPLVVVGTVWFGYVWIMGMMIVT